MKKSGFTLLEIIIAVFILTVAIVGSFALIQKSIVSASQAQFRLTAAYLIQEGTEIVRNIRDTNWLASGANWDDNIFCCGGSLCECEADYNDLALVSGDRYLKTDGGFYNYDSGSDTKFKRKITVEKISENQLKVTCKVEWEEKGRTNSIEALEYLYNWK